MSRLRSTSRLIHEAHEWMGSFPGILRMSSSNKSPEEKAELAGYAAAISRLNNELLEQWRQKHFEKGAGV